MKEAVYLNNPEWEVYQHRRRVRLSYAALSFDTRLPHSEAPEMASLSLVRLCSIKYIKTTNQYLCLFPRDVFLSHLPNFISTHKMDLVRTHSRSIADPYQLCDLVCIPLHKAGLEDFATEDIDKAKSWSTARRWYITIATVVLVVNASFASSSPSGCIPSIHEDLHVSEEAAGLTIMLFLLGYCAGPLIFAPLSEFYGEFL